MQCKYFPMRQRKWFPLAKCVCKTSTRDPKAWSGMSDFIPGQIPAEFCLLASCRGSGRMWLSYVIGTVRWILMC